MITAFSTQHKFQSKRDETLLLQTDLSRANTVIPKPIQWKDVNLPEEWILEGAAPPAIPKQLEPNTELQNVTQYSDGKVKLSFRRSNSSRFSDKASCSSIPSLEKKFTKVPSVINLPSQSQPRFSTSDLPSSSISSVDYTTKVSKTSQKLVQESKSDFAKAIREQLDRIEAASSSSSKVQIVPDTPQSSRIDTPQLSRIGVLDQDQVSIASSDLEAFTEEPIPKANKIHWELALPTSKSPPDLTIDNRPSALNQARYNASSVYEWNIDGMSEYNILGVLQQMTMAANAYKTQSGTSDKAIAEILIAGFTGQLKGWWDHLLTKLQQLDILNAIQIDENGAPILDELNNPIQDAVATLILTISLHFIGDPSHLRDKNAELLHNLRCMKLSDFNDYKTTFFTRLFLRDDANHVTWKEKFLAGLPTLLGEKVRNSIKALFDNRIPYDELTYGELVSFVNKEGLKICQDLKLQKRLKQKLRQSKQELGGFCKQFNYDPFKVSTSKDCNGKCSSKPYKKHYKSKSHRKPFNDFRKLPYKKPSRPYKKHSFSKKKEFKAKPKTPFNFKDATCFKCGMKGHTARFCKMNRRLHELGLEEEILSKIAPLLVGSSDSESSWSGDNDPLQVDELFDSDSSASSNIDFDSDNSYLKKINVLTKDQEIFLELVKHISDPNLQKDYLDKLLKTMDSSNTEASSSKIPIVKKNSYDLTEILDKRKTKKSAPNIQDLQKEIKDIKLEIKDLKEKQKTDSATIQLLLQKQLQDTSDKEVESENDDVEQKIDNLESIPNDFLFVLKQITTRKYLIKITLIFSDDFAMDAIALFDTGADLNCIREDIVPKRFREKTKERLSAANNSKLNVTSKVEASIYNDKIEFKTSFVLTNDIHHAIILGTPFINLITPYAVNYDGIYFKAKSKELAFSFIEKPKTRNLNIVKACSVYQNKINAIVMAPKRRIDKGKAPASQEPSKEPQATPSKEKLLSSAMPIKSWIELVEEHEAKYKSISSEDQVKQWISSITKSPELMIALQSLSQVQPKEEEKPTSKEISKPSSQNIVVSGESSSSQIVLSQPTPSKKTSDWFDKAHFQNIISIEDGFYHSNPFQSISKFFPQGWFFKPWDLTKPQSYYQSILEITDSVKFKHFFLSKTHSEPAYSTATILKVLSPNQWGDLLHNFKTFPLDFETRLPHCRSFSYWDYQQAWYNTFFIQNPKKSHSWLFFFNLKITVQSLPNWFHHWWNYFGPTSEILTQNALHCLNLFKANYKPTESEKIFPPFLCFCTNFFLPWVWMWSLRHHTQDSHFILQRTFRVKWWSKFDEQTKLTTNLVQNWLSAQGHLQPAIKDIKAQGTFLTQKSKAQALLASAKTEEEYFKAMEQLLASRSKSSVADSTEDEDDDDEPTVSLGDENEDDCFGIFSPIKHCK
ncbi:hypothetical protein KPL71_007778 [Citrus sinensis]|uniref:Uncharacterized protein n=1 Tax=Citrus sinensis TaxID=2711 RepID=A0ACB8M1X1_CITSI|nr:hypothetical protein KPL71_007778 [Citrus sinensis]